MSDRPGTAVNSFGRIHIQMRHTLFGTGVGDTRQHIKHCTAECVTFRMPSLMWDDVSISFCSLLIFVPLRNCSYFCMYLVLNDFIAMMKADGSTYCLMVQNSWVVELFLSLSLFKTHEKIAPTTLKQYKSCIWENVPELKLNNFRNESCAQWTWRLF